MYSLSPRNAARAPHQLHLDKQFSDCRNAVLVLHDLKAPHPDPRRKLFRCVESLCRPIHDISGVFDRLQLTCRVPLSLLFLFHRWFYVNNTCLAKIMRNVLKCRSPRISGFCCIVAPDEINKSTWNRARCFVRRAGYMKGTSSSIQPMPLYRRMSFTRTLRCCYRSSRWTGSVVLAHVGLQKITLEHECDHITTMIRACVYHQPDCRSLWLWGSSWDIWQYLHHSAAPSATREK